MINKPVCSALLGHRRPLVNAAAILYHDRSHKAAVLGTPPAGNPVASSLFFKGAVAQEGDQPFSGQRHMNVLELCKPKVSTLAQASRGGDIHMAPQRRGLSPVFP